MAASRTAHGMKTRTTRKGSRNASYGPVFCGPLRRKLCRNLRRSAVGAAAHLRVGREPPHRSDRKSVSPVEWSRCSHTLTATLGMPGSTAQKQVEHGPKIFFQAESKGLTARCAVVTP